MFLRFAAYAHSPRSPGRECGPLPPSVAAARCVALNDDQGAGPAMTTLQHRVHSAQPPFTRTGIGRTRTSHPLQVLTWPEVRLRPKFGEQRRSRASVRPRNRRPSISSAVPSDNPFCVGRPRSALRNSLQRLYSVAAFVPTEPPIDWQVYMDVNAISYATPTHSGRFRGSGPHSQHIDTLFSCR